MAFNIENIKKEQVDGPDENTGTSIRNEFQSSQTQLTANQLRNLRRKRRKRAPRKGKASNNSSSLILIDIKPPLNIKEECSIKTEPELTEIKSEPIEPKVESPTVSDSISNSTTYNGLYTIQPIQIKVSDFRKLKSESMVPKSSSHINRNKPRSTWYRNYNNKRNSAEMLWRKDVAKEISTIKGDSSFEKWLRTGLVDGKTNERNEVVEMVKMAIVPLCYPKDLITDNMMHSLAMYLFDCLQKTIEPLPIIHFGHYIVAGVKCVSCEGAASANWLHYVLDKQIIDGMRFRLVNTRELFKPVKMSWSYLHIHGVDWVHRLHMLHRNYPRLQTFKWKLVQNLHLGEYIANIMMVDRVSAILLKENGYHMYDGRVISTFKVIKDVMDVTIEVDKGEIIKAEKDPFNVEPKSEVINSEND